MNLREMDRRVGKRAWTRVRRPALPAWAWLLIDFAVVVTLVTAAVGELVSLGDEDVGQVVSLVGFVGALAVAIYNFLRTTRPEGKQPGDEESALRPSGAERWR